MSNEIMVVILILSYLSFGFLYAVVLRALGIIFKEDSKFVILFWPAHLIVRIIVLIFDFIDWVSIGSIVDFIAKGIPFSKLKD